MDQAKVYVGNISFDTRKKELSKHFSQFGKIKEIKIIIDRETSRSLGFAFIEFNSQISAKKALKQDGSELMGRQIRVNLARDRR